MPAPKKKKAATKKKAAAKKKATPKKKAAAKKTKTKSNKPVPVKGVTADYVTKPALLRIKNLSTGEWNWFTGAGWSIAKEDAKVYDTDFLAAKEAVRLGIEHIVIINA